MVMEQMGKSLRMNHYSQRGVGLKKRKLWLIANSTRDPNHSQFSPQHRKLIVQVDF